MEPKWGEKVVNNQETEIHKTLTQTAQEELVIPDNIWRMYTSDYVTSLKSVFVEGRLSRWKYEEIRLLLFKIMCLAKDGLVKDKAKTIQTIF